MNPNSEVSVGRLFKAMDWSYKGLQWARNLVHGLAEEFAGSAYGQMNRTRPRYEILVNLMNQTVDAYTMALVANRPRISIVARRQPLRFFAQQFELALNNLICEIELESTLRRAVLDAFFLMGIVKMHLLGSPQVQIEADLLINPTKPFASNVSIDDFVVDMAAKKYSMVQYAGDWYRIPFADLKEDIFDQKVIKQLELKPTSKWDIKEGGDRLDQIAAGQATDQDELEPMIDLCDVWVRRDRMIYTFPVDPRRPFASATKVIAALPWDNPQHGPYPVLSFNEMPENIVPPSPASHLASMARIINNVARKQARRAHAQKENPVYTPASVADAEKIKRASDQQWVPVMEASEVNVVKTGGVDQPLQAYMSGLLQLYDRMAGNLSAMMGLGPQAPTLGQEEMIQGAVSKKEARMHQQVTEFAVKVVRHLGYMLWNDRSMTIPGSLTLPGLENYAPMDMTWTPDQREGGFFDYDLNIDVHSMPYQSPNRKLQTILALVQNVFLPAAPMLAQQGKSVDLGKIAEIAAKLLDQPELEEIITSGAVPMPGPQGQHERTMPSTSSREYIRRSVPTGGSPQARSMAQEQAWLAGRGEASPSPQTVEA